MRFAVVLLVAMSITGGVAEANQRFASPTGGGSECIQAKPCELKEAVTKASANDEVIVTAGAYTLLEPLSAEASGLSIHGDFGGPMPTISSTINGFAFQVEGQGSVISYLEMTDTGQEANPLFCIESRVERVRMAGIGKRAYGLYQAQGCLVRDSVVLASGEGATALDSVGISGSANVARNVTAIADGPDSVGIGSFNNDPTSPGVHSLDLKNSIAQGDAFDLLAHGEIGDGEMFVSNSNFDHGAGEGSSKITGLGGNQTAQPLFVDAAGGDYREAAGSPTIDAGIVDQLGALDLAGNPRVLGAAPDIGAYETAAPPSAVTSELRSLRLSPTTFRASNLGGAVASRRKRRPPVGSTVTYNLSAPGTIDFSLERTVRGRRVGGKCHPATAANRRKKKCTFYKPVKGGFSVAGAVAGDNSFVFSGRIGNRALKPGGYRLVGRLGATSKGSRFKIVR